MTGGGDSTGGDGTGRDVGFYEGVHARPDGESSVRRCAAHAANLGYDGLVVRNHGDARSDVDLEAVSETADLDVVDGLEVRADSPEQASGYVGNYRPKYTVLLVHGGSNRMNRFAVEQDRVDVLAHPMRGDGDVNHVLAKAAAEHGVRLEFDFANVLRATGGRRVQALSDLRKLRELVEQYDAPYVVSAVGTSHRHLRGPRALAAVGETIGFSREQIHDGLREWGHIVARTREVRHPDFVEPGVRRGRYADRNDGSDSIGGVDR
ncbi:ribonuclease P [Halorubellus sp. JP-L1]|uniref:RNase P subunit p30 family protein n=1 Tax=Halorubellus sp. JP-L1 TaxID=2715753 RepID=UPI0014096B20|nr:RNase P subunit p30 family protein [Halorubellus sp. JP-L1]NHN40313.1 ribonuclease P [Halorubellus sp. JP-L1]